MPRVAREIGRIYRTRFGILIAASVVIFIPLGLLDAIDDSFEDLDLDSIDDLELFALIGLTLFHVITAMLGDVFYAGIVAGAVMFEREGHAHPLRELVRTLPYGRLIAIDVLLAVVVALGALLLIVPGVVFLTWFALATPAAKIEGRRVIDSFRRSRELVRVDFWRVLVIVIPVVIVSEVIAGAIESGALAEIGDTFAGDWIGSTASSVLTAPFFALAVVVLFYDLRTLANRS